MKKSLMISGSYFPPQVGGISHLVAEICATLGPGAVSVLTGVSGNDGDDARNSRLNVYRRPRAFDKRSAVRPVWLASAMAEVVLRERPGILQFATTEDTDIAWWAYRTLRLPYLIYAHGNEILSAIRSEWEKPRQALSNAACVIANSRYTASLVEQAGVDRHRIEIVYPGCDVHRFEPADVDAATRRALLGERWNDRVILTVGNLVERKGHDIAMMAMKRVITRVPDACYVIAGDGPHRPTLQKLAGELGIADRVVFAGRVADEQLPLYYRLCDVFLMPSRARVELDDVEGFGIVFLEAGACGKPSIGGRSGGVEDAIADNRTGLLVEPGDPDQVASALESLLLNPDFAKKLGDQARKHVVAEHNWPETGNRIAEIIAAVGAGR